MASALLEAGQYDRVAEILQEAQLSGEPSDETSLTNILTAAYHISLSCSQCQTETEWHELAHKQADRREGELNVNRKAKMDNIAFELAQRKITME